MSKYFDCSITTILRSSKSSIFRKICFEYDPNFEIDKLIFRQTKWSRTFHTEDIVQDHIELGKDATQRAIAKKIGCDPHTVMNRQKLPEYWEEFNKRL